MTVAIEREPALCIVPGQRGKPAFDGLHRIRFGSPLGRSGGASGNVEADPLGGQNKISAESYALMSDLGFPDAFKLPRFHEGGQLM